MRLTHFALLTVSLTLSFSALAQTKPALNEQALKNLATCNYKDPIDWATAHDALYEPVTKTYPKEDIGFIGADVYKLPEPISLAEGLTATHFIFLGSGAGFIIEGEQAENIAKQYKLSKKPIKNAMYGGNWFAKVVKQNKGDYFKTVLVTQYYKMIPNKTMIYCNMVDS